MTTRWNPPKAVDALLRAALTVDDGETISGDLLEVYREERRPAQGRVAADMWYLSQVAGIVWRLVWPCVVAVAALRVLSFPIPRGWNPSLVPAPGVSGLDAVIFLWAGFYGARRTGRFLTGMVTAATTSVAGFSLFMIYAGVTQPRLLLAPFQVPFVIVIALVLLAMTVGFALFFGTMGAAAGRRWMSSRRHAGLS